MKNKVKQHTEKTQKKHTKITKTHTKKTKNKHDTTKKQTK